MWLNPLLESGDGSGAVCSESAFPSADSDGRDFPHISKIEDPPITFADVERSTWIMLNSVACEFECF